MCRIVATCRFLSLDMSEDTYVKNEVSHKTFSRSWVRRLTGPLSTLILHAAMLAFDPHVFDHADTSWLGNRVLPSTSIRLRTFLDIYTLYERVVQRSVQVLICTNVLVWLLSSHFDKTCLKPFESSYITGDL
jgi:hypothetical protein